MSSNIYYLKTTNAGSQKSSDRPKLRRLEREGSNSINVRLETANNPETSLERLQTRRNAETKMKLERRKKQICGREKGNL